MSKWLLALLWVAGITIGLIILVASIQTIWNHFRGKWPVDYGYTFDKIKVFLDFPSFRSFYLAAPENFNLGDEYVFFREDGYKGSNTSTRIGFKTLADLWDYQNWKEKIDSKRESAENDAATLEFCQAMTTILEEKKLAELKKAQNAARVSMNVLDNFTKDGRPLPPTTDSILGGK